MKTKEVLEEAIKDVKKEWEWILLEGRWIQKLKYAVKIGDYNQIRRFERKAARSERRIFQFEERVLGILDFLRQRFPSWNQGLSELEERTKICDGNILRRVSLVDGTIPKLIKEAKINWKRNLPETEGKWSPDSKIMYDINQINTEIDNVMNEGVRPLIALLDHLRGKLETHLKKVEIDEEIRKVGVDERTEAFLDKQPFMIIFHSANNRELVNHVLALGGSLPDIYMGRRIEYAFEVDYIWIEHEGKVSGFFGHTMNIWRLQPRKAKKILSMYRGKTNLLTRKGLLVPEWLFSRLGKIRLIIDIHKGFGSDPRAMDELVRKLRSYHLEREVIIDGHSPWPLHYLRPRLPGAFFIINMFRMPLFGIQSFLPITNRLPESFLRFGFRELPFVDAFVLFKNNSEKKIKQRVKETLAKGKGYIELPVKTKEKLDWLIEHGARGCFVDVTPEAVISWLSIPSTTKQ